ncbi:MAG: LD-carboxypeptidase [Bacteroidales bacterium]|nr:LD-carboxypeptidase [Bacteroidales bacterium]
MIKPPYLKKGDKIGIISPAGKISKDIIDPAISLLEKMGYIPVKGTHIYAGEFQMAGKDEQRLSDIQQMINDPEIKAIFATRGGYGLVRIIDKIDFKPLVTNPKWIVGYSDITILHAHLQGKLHLASIHGVMLKEYQSCSQRSLNSLTKSLSGSKSSYEIKSHPFNQPGECDGILTGGNLSIICSLLGSSTEINTDGKILFIEEIGEHHYHIDRMIRQLKRAGKLKNLAGLIVGSFSHMRDEPKDFGMTAYEIIAQAISEYDFPVCFDFPAGHTENNYALVLGTEMEIDIRPSVSVLRFT